MASLTPLQKTIDESIAQLVAARASLICQHGADEDSANDLRALSELALRLARAIDPLFDRIAIEGGLADDDRADLRSIVTDAISGNLDFLLEQKANAIGDRAHQRSDQNEWGTLNRRMQGI